RVTPVSIWSEGAGCQWRVRCLARSNSLKLIRSVTRALARLLRPLDQFNFVTFRRVDKGEDCAGRGRGRAIRVSQSEFFELLPEFFEAVHLESQMRQVRLHLHRAARREAANLNLLLAFRRFEEDQF